MRVCHIHCLLFLPALLRAWSPSLVPLPSTRLPATTAMRCWSAARNESAVIGDLIHSIKVQNYPSRAHRRVRHRRQLHRRHRATSPARPAPSSFVRNNDPASGQGLCAGLGLPAPFASPMPTSGYEAFFVFDADNVLDCQLLPRDEQDLRRRRQGFHQLSQLRRTTAPTGFPPGYAVWFLREAKFLNQARLTLNTSCAVSGTGFFISRRHHREERRLEVAPAHRGHRVLRVQHCSRARASATAPPPSSTTSSPSPSATPGTSASAGPRASTRCSAHYAAGAWRRAPPPTPRAVALRLLRHAHDASRRACCCTIVSVHLQRHHRGPRRSSGARCPRG